MKLKRIFGLPLAVLLLMLVGAVPAWAGTATYTGQGFNYDGTTYNLNDERCGLTGQNDADDGGTGQFANWNGPGQPYVQGDAYLVWVLTANGATSATLSLPDGTVDMIQVGGTFKYASRYYDPEVLIGLPVTATYFGNARGRVQLVVSHGCQAFTTEGAWCSPGYWGNAQDAAWALIGVDKYDAFNDTVVPDFYANASLAHPTIIQVLTLGQGVNANTYGAAAAPYGLNAFNATGAYLTAQIPGFHFDPELVGEDEACPIDNHGNYKFP